MLSKLRLWWQKTRGGFQWLWQKIQQHRFVAVGMLVALSALTALTLTIYAFGWNWTGFNGGYGKTTIISAAHETTISTEQPQARTLWDWMSLLIVPIMLAIGGFWLNNLQKERDSKAEEAQKQREEKAVEQRAQAEQKIAADNQCETALQAYIDKMSELLLEKDLLGSSPKDEVRTIARVRTITILFQLDARRVGYVFTFLREAGLMSNDANSSIVSLSQADLSKIDLSQTDLSKANLSGAYLIEADLSGANLSGANLSGANLKGANLKGANLKGANFSGTDLSKANLSGAELIATDLRGASLIEADLSEAYLIEADLSEAYLIEADLSEAYLSKADLRGADLRGANLSGADLRGANLSGAIGFQERLEKAKSLRGATMPDESIHP